MNSDVPITAAAKWFDEPIESQSHATLRDTAWTGGALVEGPYLLGRLTNTNQFVNREQHYLPNLAAYLRTKYPNTADRIATDAGLDYAVKLLRKDASNMTDIHHTGDNLENLAAHAIALDPTITDRELARALECTDGQLSRVSFIARARKILHNQT